jgi:two-component system sensor histidine kinase DesK
VRLRLLPDDPQLGYTPFAWLVYATLVPFYLYVRGAGPLSWAANLLGLAAFFFLYFRGFWFTGRAVLPYASGLVALGAIFAPFNPGASAYFVYGAAFLGHALPTGLAVRWLALFVAIAGLEAALLRLHPAVWIPAIVGSLVVGLTNIHFGEVNRQNARLRMAREEVERLARTAERERIGRDLHDLLGHTLSLVTLKSELARRLLERDPQRAARELDEVLRVSREALSEVRRAVAGFRQRDLPAELASARLVLEAAGVALDASTPALVLGAEREAALSLALREAVTNVVRHAGATRCRIELGVANGEARLVVEDDGRGGPLREGSGLAGMRERIEALGGRLLVDGRSGTRVEVVLPAGGADEPRALRAAC